MLNQCYIGDCIEGLRAFADAGISARVCVTSPPYWGLRDYGHPDAYGLEATPDEYLNRMVGVFRAVRDVLADDATVWLNMGDSYAGNGGQSPQTGPLFKGRARQRENICLSLRGSGDGLKPKDMIGMPWQLALALRDDGWYLRQDIIWHKPAPMPESVRDRCTKAHEYLFLLSKSNSYYYDQDAIRERAAYSESVGLPKANELRGKSWHDHSNDLRQGQSQGISTDKKAVHEKGRNRRSVWTIASEPYANAHFATFPRKLVEPCVLAGSAPGDVVLDPFMGSGTTAQVAESLDRKWIGCEINPEYVTLQADRLRQQNLDFASEEQSK